MGKKGTLSRGKTGFFAKILSISNMIFAAGLPSILRIALSGSSETPIINLQAIITKNIVIFILAVVKATNKGEFSILSLLERATS